MRGILIVALATVIGSTTAVLAQSSRDLTEPTGTEANRLKQQLGGYYGGVYRSYAYVKRIIIAPIDRRQAWHELAPRRQIFVRSQQAWVNNLNPIPKFDGMPPR
jgi:hypothetical protein